MKKVFAITLAVLLSVAGVTVAAQDVKPAKEVKRELKQNADVRREVRKASEKELKQKATKDARKEAKNLAKEGWRVVPGGIPLDKQLDRTYLMQMETIGVDTPKYLWGQAMSTGGSYDAANMQAVELAKLNLVSQIESEITVMVENSVANEQMSEGDAASLVKTVTASKSVITQKLGRIRPILTAYRDTKNGNKEVMVRIAYDLNPPST